MSTATTTATSDDDDRDATAAAAEITETRSKIDQLMSLLPGLEAKRADAADRRRRQAVTALRERIEPTLGAETEALRTAMRALEKATADVLTAGDKRNARIIGGVAAMTEVGISAHPTGNAPMPSPEFSGLGYSRRSGDVSIVVDLRHERVASPAQLVDVAVSSGKRVAAGSDPDAFGVLDGLVTTVKARPPMRYFVSELRQVHMFDAAQVDEWPQHQRDRFTAEITEAEAWRIGWGLARIEHRTAGGIEVTPTTPGR